MSFFDPTRTYPRQLTRPRMAASSLRLVFVDLDRVDIGVRGINSCFQTQMKRSIALGTTLVDGSGS